MKKLLLIITLCTLYSCVNNKKSIDEINVYTKRHYQSDKDLFKKFEAENNIKVNVVKASSDELIERIKTEGSSCPADILITVDAGKLYKAASNNLLQKLDVDEINKNILPQLKDKNGFWIPITYRARVIVYNPKKVKKEELLTYEDLTNAKWKNRILVRSSTNAYNQALLSSILTYNGEEESLNWANNLVNNFAREPKGNDRDQVRAIVSGIGDLAIVNSYYIALLKTSEDSLDRKVGESVQVFFPNQDETNRGSHINISGLGLLKNSPNKRNALKLIKFLTSEYAQNYYTNNSYEYPVLSNVSPSNLISEWGDFKIDTLDLNKLGINRKKAVDIFQKSKWN